VDVDSWGAIREMKIESSDPDFIISSIEKLKPVMPKSSPPPEKKPQG